MKSVQERGNFVDGGKSLSSYNWDKDLHMIVRVGAHVRLFYE